MIKVNYSIRAPQVRVVKDSKQVGIKSISDAIFMAKNEGLDLIEVAPQAKPPVCIIADYDKYRYEQALKEKDKKRGNITNQDREMWFFPNIEEHDLLFKLKKIRGFIEKKCSVQIIVKKPPAKKNRGPFNIELGMEIIKRIIENVSDVAEVVSQPKISRNSIIAKISIKKVNDGN